MSDVLLLAEDPAQEKFVSSILRRLARELKVQLSVHLRVSTGYGGVIHDLRKLAKDYEAGHLDLPDMIVVAIDSNCHGLNDRRDEVREAAGTTLAPRLAAAIANPHVERWYLLDGGGFKTVFGRGCQAPDQKCEKDRYKRVLTEAIRESGVEPLLGGVEYAEDLANSISIERASAADGGFREFVEEVRAHLKRENR